MMICSLFLSLSIIIAATSAYEVQTIDAKVLPQKLMDLTANALQSPGGNRESTE